LTFSSFAALYKAAGLNYRVKATGLIPLTGIVFGPIDPPYWQNFLCRRQKKTAADGRGEAA